MALWLNIVIYALFLAALVAILEIQIEGQHGWAEKLPCKRKTTGGKFFKILNGLFNDNRPLTSYHVALNAMMIAMWHMIFLFVPWSVRAEIFIVGLLLLFFVTEDFLWFVFNPYYGLRRFKPEMIWWHKTWLNGAPSWYFFFMLVATLCIFVGHIAIG